MTVRQVTLTRAAGMLLQCMSTIGSGGSLYVKVPTHTLHVGTGCCSAQVSLPEWQQWGVMESMLCCVPRGPNVPRQLPSQS